MKKWLLLPLCLILFYFAPKKGVELYDEIPKGSEDCLAIAPLLNQRFTYLGEGSQLIAFAAADGKHVLKVFKARHARPYKFSRYIRAVHGKDREVSKQKWKIKFQDTARRYKMAWIDLKEETGLVHLHFEKTPVSLPVRLKGKAFDLSKYPFIIQKKAVLAPKYVTKHPEGAVALKTFFKARLDKGFSDPRQTLSTNYGFIGNTPIQIDPGKLEKFEGDKEKELRKINKKIDEWELRL